MVFLWHICTGIIDIQLIVAALTFQTSKPEAGFDPKTPCVLLVIYVYNRSIKKIFFHESFFLYLQLKWWISWGLLTQWTVTPRKLLVRVDQISAVVHKKFISRSLHFKISFISRLSTSSLRPRVLRDGTCTRTFKSRK